MSQDSRRPSLRLKGYDYSAAGAYFVTICARRRVWLFGDICAGEMHLSRAGSIVRDEWFRAAAVRPRVHLHEDELVIMPDHLHAILWVDDVGAVKLDAPADNPVEATPWVQEAAERASDAKPEPCVAGRREAQPWATPAVLGNIIGQFKSLATKRINVELETPGVTRWQRGYYEHVIRNQEDLKRIRVYIRDNPARWSSRQNR